MHKLVNILNHDNLREVLELCEREPGVKGCAVMRMWYEACDFADDFIQEIGNDRLPGWHIEYTSEKPKFLMRYKNGSSIDVVCSSLPAPFKSSRWNTILYSEGISEAELDAISAYAFPYSGAPTAEPEESFEETEELDNFLSSFIPPCHCEGGEAARGNP